jgi:hypothetical protein
MARRTFNQYRIPLGSSLVILSLVATAALLSACASGPTQHPSAEWSKPGVTAEQRARDFSRCEREYAYMTRCRYPEDPSCDPSRTKRVYALRPQAEQDRPVSEFEAVQRKLLRNDCMARSGYSRN